MKTDKPNENPNAAPVSPLVGAPLAPTMLRMAIPGVIGALIFTLLNTVEASYLQKIGTDALAGVALMFPLIMLAMMFSAGAIGGAVSGHIARALGGGDHHQASRVLASAIMISIVGGAIMAFVVLALGPLFYHAGSGNAVVADAARSYAWIIFPFMPLIWLTNMLCSVLRGCGDMVRPAIVAAVIVMSYMLLGWLLIPDAQAGLLLAIQRAAWAMAGAYFVSTLLALFFILQKSQPIRLQLSSFSWSATQAVLRQGLVASAQSTMTIAYAMVATALFGRFGVEWTAGYGLAVRLELIMVPIIFGIGSTLIAIVGAYVGAGQRDKAIRIAWLGVLINALIVGVIGVFMALQPSLWCDTLASEQTVAAHCRQSLRVMAPTYAFLALGLGSYFASQALNTLLWPVTGAFLRLAIVATGLLWVSANTSPTFVLFLVAAAVVAYGCVVVGGLFKGPWSRTG